MESSGGSIVILGNHPIRLGAIINPVLEFNVD